MAYKFGNRSKQALARVHPDLVKLCNKVLELEIFDFGITCGYRGQDAQNQLYFEGRSRVKWPDSKHNKDPSEAIDFVLYINGEVNWDDTNAWYMAIGVFRAVAIMLDIEIRAGGDWSGDFSTQDQTFFDLTHIELV